MKHRIGGSPTGAFGSAVKLSHLRSKPRSASSAGSEDRDLTLQACDLVNIILVRAVAPQPKSAKQAPHTAQFWRPRERDFGISDRIE
jgi:hypothetical protein